MAPPKQGRIARKWETNKRAGRWDDDDDAKRLRQTGESAVIGKAYGARINSVRDTEGGFNIPGVRGVNNFVKSVLLGKYLTPGCSVLDIACGKGGDMNKFKSSNIGLYVGMDVAEKSLEDAISRYNGGGGRPAMPFTAHFYHGDCFAVDVDRCLPPALGFDVVSCMFAIHYGFGNYERARQALRNAAGRLQPGGHFVGTTTDANVLRSKLRAAAPALEFGNMHYKIVFEEKSAERVLMPNGAARDPWGLRYTFTLEGAVDGLDEFLVPRGVIERLGEEVGLKLVSYANLIDVFDEAKDTHKDILINRIKAFVAPHFRITPEEWEVIHLYAAFDFVKPLEEGKPAMKAVHPGRRVHSRLEPTDVLPLVEKM